MFYGEHEHTLDRKGRLIIPSKFREVAQANYVEKFFVTRGLDKCLFFFTEEEWKNQEAKFKSLSFTKSEARRFNRLYFSGACELTVDKQGRVLIPKYLKDFAGIRHDVIVIGVSNRIEIWAKDKWKEFYEASKDSFEETAENLIDPSE
ncbi:MAG: division/cell wall cluster transcriptional repressor MraZ [Bacteroidetes bacterium]|nr:division/cell wall cluster transcriptional repressor MraZ [Bacteroidota bacterium]